MRGLSSVRIGSVALVLAGIAHGRVTQAQFIPCYVEWKGMPQDHGDADLAVGTSHVLVADHDHYRVFTKCGQNQSFLVPFAPTGLPNGIPLNGAEAVSPPTPPFHHGLHWDDLVPWTWENGTSVLGDERVIFDPITSRFIAMATTPPALGVFLGVSNTDDARTWPASSIRSFPMEVPCVNAELGALHRGSISTSNDPLNPGDSLVWFIGEVQHPICYTCPCPNSELLWSVGKFRMSQVLNGNPDPDSWWQESAYDYANFSPTLARRLTDDGTPQYAIGANFATNSLELLALRPEANAQGRLLTPYRHTISLTQPPYNISFQALPAKFKTSDPDTYIKPYPMAAIWKAVYRDGFIWAVHYDGAGVFPNDRSVVRWYKIAMNGWNGGTPTPTIADWGTLTPGDTYYCYVPSIAAHRNNGAVAITYNATSDSHNISIYSHTRCNASSPFGPAVLQYVHPSVINNDGESNGNGDYSGTVEDPSVPGRFWLHHVLGPVDPTNLPFPSGAGSIVRRFQAPGCGADFTGDGVANGSDAVMFGQFFVQGAPEADFIPDEVIDGNDILEYLEVGLP